MNRLFMSTIIVILVLSLSANANLTVDTPSITQPNTGNASAVAGYFTQLQKDPIIYEIPTDPDVWNYVFFVGGDAVRDGAGILTSIEQAQVSSQRRDEFLNIILSIKPMLTWAGLVIVFN